ncbi:MAG: 30S ribosomal protein S9 [Nitrospinae bacterium]|jgi:small subunit ribosomal protein S9|nr:30S ribosomal protein S9 [Nitrospinota bacterium]MDA1108425.1 30S ribosomal protein S9 [Nitrospinota bacterium]
MESSEVRYYATGKRKESIAKVWLHLGDGKISINNRTLEEYFRRDSLQTNAQLPLVLTQTLSSYDVKATVLGGGLSGQSGALRLGIARALIILNPELRTPLKRAGFLTRDAREVERKKYGQPGARKKYQFSKR